MQDWPLHWDHLGQMIARDRKRKRMTQKALADASGLTQRTVGNYERGIAPASAPDIPAGYFAVGAALGWPDDAIERVLTLGEPERGPAPAPPPPSPGDEDYAPTLRDLFPIVSRFAEMAIAEGARPEVRDRFMLAAHELLYESTERKTAGPTAGSDQFDLAAYRPHGWAEGDPAVPADDAARIRKAVEDHRQNR